jgi:hypothetical protein
MRTRCTAGAVTAAAVALAGCGSEHDYKNEARPPAPIVLSASISDREVAVSPRAIGAGPLSLTVTNQTDAAQRVTIESSEAAGEGPGLRQETSPISPNDTATLTADVTPGRYVVHVRGDGIRAARLLVGRERPSAQNDLLQP